MGWHPLLIALAACAHAKWHVIHGSHTSHNERRGPGNNRYLTYNETEGLNNQRIALENARLMAILLNRTLVVPDTIPPHDAGDPFPTKTCRVFTCDSLRVPWVSQRYFEDHRKRWPTRIRDDAARCGDVATCEDFLLDPPKNVVVEVPVDKTMYHMSLSSPKRWVLSKMKDDRELNPNVLTVNSRLITRAKMIVDKLGAAYDAAHLRTGDYFDALYTDEVPPSERKALPPPPEPKLAPSRRESLDGPLYADELAAYNAARRQEHGGGQGHGGGHGRRRGQKRGGGDGKPTMVRESYQIRANSLGAGQGERRASWSSPLNSGAYSCIEGPEPRLGNGGA
ncbi:hypothetical protein AURANDRAFT_67943 [Aureococcus anophagefferens]|uniref:Uncharacterized protein n=1 Tax=Aureococcus anophagefferens TaxID=44056 RepID=F0YMY9_AURAN|nr:hypothetical protein AURANDRAFT_67943 [Aureococcus anophagefferens]EGB03526.1 hypothetical protein AURANDRAFT_67943 [Aureococcus anophagefferens]|eukprot:XP_009041793.1 hypothetical protein AURANDRAFT_67943 [Aureococcus anophagefferens]